MKLHQSAIFLVLFSLGCFSSSQKKDPEDGLPGPEQADEPAVDVTHEDVPASRPAIEQLYVIARQDQGFKIYSDNLATQQTVVAGGKAHFATLDSTGTEELSFETNFVEKSEVESENYRKESRPYGHFQVDAKLGDDWALATPGHVEIASVKQMKFESIQPDTSVGILKMLEAKLSAEDLSLHEAEKVQKFEDSYVIQFAEKSMWFIKEQLVFEVLWDYGPGEIYPKVSFTHGGASYYAGEYLIKRRIENIVVAVMGEHSAVVPIDCGQCSASIR